MPTGIKEEVKEEQKRDIGPLATAAPAPAAPAHTTALSSKSKSRQAEASEGSRMRSRSPKKDSSASPTSPTPGEPSASASADEGSGYVLVGQNNDETDAHYQETVIHMESLHISGTGEGPQDGDAGTDIPAQDRWDVEA